MMMMILAMILMFKCLLSAIDFATRYSTRYSDFLSQPYSNPTRSQKALLAGACLRVTFPGQFLPVNQPKCRSRKSDLSIKKICFPSDPFFKTVEIKEIGRKMSVVPSLDVNMD